MNPRIIEYKLEENKKFAEECYPTLESRGGLSIDEWAKKETEEWVMRMEKLAEEEANEEMVDVFTGKKLGKRKDVERRGETGDLF